MVFFGGEFSPFSDKKRANKSNKESFENFKKKLPYLKKKKLEVIKFR